MVARRCPLVAAFADNQSQAGGCQPSQATIGDYHKLCMKPSLVLSLENQAEGKNKLTDTEARFKGSV